MIYFFDYLHDHLAEYIDARRIIKIYQIINIYRMNISRNGDLLVRRNYQGII